MRRVVFVCSGNICRSPMATVIARHHAAERNVPIAAISCGTLGLVGHAAATHAVSAVAEIGLDLSDHYSQGVSPPMIRLADHVVVMAPKHEDAILNLAPELASKIVRFWEFADDELDEIADPVGQDLEAFRRCRDRLLECSTNWFDSLE